MPTPQQLLQWMASHIGMPYAADDQRLVLDSPTTDCSGAVWRALVSVGDDPGPNRVSETLQTWAQSSGGALIPVAQGIVTPGAGLFVWGSGPNGHVALSRGNGTTYETPAWGPYGHALGIGNAYGRGWTGACLWPGIDYSNVWGAPTGYPPLTRVLRPGCAGPDVHELQIRLLAWAYVLRASVINPGVLDGMFGPNTENAVKAFQLRARIAIDGLVGPATWAALWGR